ncbi:hypothetical protein EON77_18705, partial [bacterium]
MRHLASHTHRSFLARVGLLGGIGLVGMAAATGAGAAGCAAPDDPSDAELGRAAGAIEKGAATTSYPEVVHIRETVALGASTG